jgi:hypothetical protein
MTHVRSFGRPTPRPSSCRSFIPKKLTVREG